MKVYHGSDLFIEKIDLNKSKHRRDFGRGFYVTNLPEQANTMAERIALWNKSRPVVTEFELDEFVFIDSDLKTIRFDGYNDEWLDFVVLNRNNNSEQQAHDYDIVEGPVADDRISTQIKQYMEENISKEQFLNDLVYTPSHQICFCTVQSLQALSLAKGKKDIAIFSIGDEVMQMLMSDYGISETEVTDLYYMSVTYARLSDESTGWYLKPWQEIYELLKTELKI